MAGALGVDQAQDRGVRPRAVGRRGPQLRAGAAVDVGRGGRGVARACLRAAAEGERDEQERRDEAKRAHLRCIVARWENLSEQLRVKEGSEPGSGVTIHG